MGVAYNPTIPKQGLQFLYDEGNTSKSGLDKDLVSGTSLSFSTNFTQVSEFSNLTKLTAASDVGGSSAPAASSARLRAVEEPWKALKPTAAAQGALSARHPPPMVHGAGC